jgi:hypothetical protein
MYMIAQQSCHSGVMLVALPVKRTPGVSGHALQVAPGVDLERDILAHMPFRPLMGDVKAMDARCFEL